ncbi:hypothetical protein [Microvirga sp. TS319]|uniref:hypothetical protein n=1 Tax=Microvirga sp. TS319 TaxID=3241165 RepID=UPI00351A084F
MLAWATIIALTTSALSSILDPAIVLNVAELLGVTALFALVCAAEAFSEPRN